MPLLEALLTEGSTAAKFDARMNGLGPNTRVHLGPSSRDAYGVVIPFQTKGYAYNVSGGWQIKPGMKIIGSGMEVTTLQLVNHTAGESYSAIGHDISAGVTADFSEVSDLTIDCKLSQDGAETAASAVRLMGAHARIFRVRASTGAARTVRSHVPCSHALRHCLISASRKWPMPELMSAW